MNKSSLIICGFKNNPYICIVFQLSQANVSPTTAVGIFCAVAENNNSSVPCGALMRPLPDLGGRQRGAELFSSPGIYNSIVSF